MRFHEGRSGQQPRHSVGVSSANRLWTAPLRPVQDARPDHRAGLFPAAHLHARREQDLEKEPRQAGKISVGSPKTSEATPRHAQSRRPPCAVTLQPEPTFQDVPPWKDPRHEGIKTSAEYDRYRFMDLGSWKKSANGNLVHAIVHGMAESLPDRNLPPQEDPDLGLAAGQHPQRADRVLWEILNCRRGA